ncbi:MAG TPA: hypothetical protein QGF52_00480 [Nitrososphaerales archaeon]|jgi:rRNA-processing protein FCF1|nr:hypothetical protein [Nitrososphaerales archaeon]|tara:strand:+ start:7135 stop:7560 length:426 start_codon:yes stop_codon:yes gene_type:complete
MASHWFWNNNIAEPSIVELLLDSSFLIFAVSTPSQRLEQLQEFFGKVDLVVLDAVINELHGLSRNSSPKRAKFAKSALNFASGLKNISFDEGENVDDKIMNCAVSRRASVATLDSNLRKQLKVSGITVVFRKGNLLAVEKT